MKKEREASFLQRRLKLYLAFIFTVCVSTVLSVYLFEGVLWYFDPLRSMPFNGWRQGVRYTWGHRVDLNSAGFRGREFESPKPEGTYRVMVLGDSLTWGAGLSDNERYVYLAEQALQKQYTDPRVEVLSFARAGDPTIRELEVLEKYYRSVKPDRIVIGFCLNDPQPRGEDYSVEQEAIDRALMPVTQTIPILGHLYGFPRTGKLIRKGVFEIARYLDFIPSTRDALQRAYELDSPEWKKFVASLERIKAISDELNLCPPVLLLLNQGGWNTSADEYNEGIEYIRRYLKWYRQAADAARSQGFQVYDILDRISRLKDERLAVNPYDGHPSAALNRLYAEILVEAVGPDVIRPGSSEDSCQR